MRFTVDEYSKYYKVSKQVIYSKIRTKKLSYVIENGITYIDTDSENRPLVKKEPQKAPLQVQKKPEPPKEQKSKLTVGTILSLYQKENQQLKNRIKELEGKVDRLVEDKERILLEERKRIESIYASKDEQLKNILEMINTKLLLQQEEKEMVHDVEFSRQSQIQNVPTHEDEGEDDDEELEHSTFVELRSYLKTLDMRTAERKTIKKRFMEKYGHDIRIIQQNGQFYLDFSKYDYTDLLQR